MEERIMKKSLFFGLIAVLGLLGCTRNQEIDIQENGLSLIARTEMPAETKTVVEGGTHVFWEPGDEIMVFSGEKSAKFVSDLTTSSAKAIFTGTFGEDAWPEDMNLWAVYPYSSEAVFDGETITTSLPYIQVARSGSFGKDMNLAVAHSTDNSLQFYNVGGGVRFSVSEEGVTRVIFEGRLGEKIAGKIQIGFGVEGVPFVKKVIEGSEYITVLPPSGESFFQKDTWYYIVALPKSLNLGYKIRFYRDRDYASRINTKRVIIKRSVFGCIEHADEGISYEATRTRFPETAEEWEQSYQLTQNVAGSITSLIHKLRGTSEDNLVDPQVFISQVSSIEDIIDAFPSSSGGPEVVVVQKDGVHINVFLNDWEEITENEPEQLEETIPEEIWEASPIKVEQSDDLNSERTALVLAPFRYLKWRDSFPINVDHKYIATSLPECFQTISLLDTDAGLDAFRPDYLEQFNLIIIATHGGYFRDSEGNVRLSLSTGSFRNDVNPELNKVKGILLSEAGLRNAITTTWFRMIESLQGKTASFEKSIIVAMACYSLANNDFATYFLNRGAAAYCGNTREALIKDIKAGAHYIPAYLGLGLSLQNSVDMVVAENPSLPLHDVTKGEGPVYLLDSTPTELTMEADGSIVSFRWNRPLSKGTFTFDVYIDDFPAAETLTRNEYSQLLYTPGWHSWRVEANLHYGTQILESFRSETKHFYIEEVPDFIDLGLSVKWGSRNLGTDYPEQIGDLYAWGETETKTRYTWGTYKWSLDPDNPNYNDLSPHSLTKYCNDGKQFLDLQDDAAHCLLGGNCRMPTRGEFEELLNNSKIERTILGGVSGYKFTSTVPGYTDKWIFIVPGTIEGSIWSSELSWDSTYSSAWSLKMSSGKASIKMEKRCLGLPIRPVCDY